eukprot:jgi/Tetstr1/421806/TSEL_012708.t1
MTSTKEGLPLQASGTEQRRRVTTLLCYLALMFPACHTHLAPAGEPSSRGCGHGAVQELMTRRLARYHGAARLARPSSSRYSNESRLLTPQNEPGGDRRALIELGSLPVASEAEDSHSGYYPPAGSGFQDLLAGGQGGDPPPEGPAAIRFHLDYRLAGLQAEQPLKAAFLRSQLVPAMVASLQRYISVRRPVPESVPLLLPRLCMDSWGAESGGRCRKVEPIGRCLLAAHDLEFFGPYQTCTSPDDDSTCVSSPGGSGALDADFLLYVSASQEGCGEGVAAFAGACELDPATRRPVAGEVNFCPDYILTDRRDWGYMLDTAVHEMLHALVMHDALFPFFVDSELRPLERVVTTLEGGKKQGISTPSVVAALRAHRSCDDLQHMPLEDGGGHGTALAHWELSAALDEIMVGVSAVQGFQRQVVSNITLALLHDSGWYTPSWAAAGLLGWGRGAGCGFGESCAGDGFCPPPQAAPGGGCSWDLTAVGTCQRPALADACGMRIKFNDYICTDAGGGNPLYAASGADWGEAFGPTARCLGEPASHLVTRAFPSGTGPLPSERSSVLPPPHGGEIKQAMGAGCYAMSCDPGGQLFVSIAGVALRCPEGAYVDLAASAPLRSLGFLGGRLGPCPPASRVCPAQSCGQAGCVQGECWDGECRCYVGAGGPDCAGKPVAASTPQGAAPWGPLNANLTLGQLPQGDAGWTLYLPEDEQLPFSPVFWGSMRWQEEVTTALGNITRVERPVLPVANSSAQHLVDQDSHHSNSSGGSSSCAGHSLEGCPSASSAAAAEGCITPLVVALALACQAFLFFAEDAGCSR